MPETTEVAEAAFSLLSHKLMLKQHLYSIVPCHVINEIKCLQLSILYILCREFLLRQIMQPHR